MNAWVAVMATVAVMGLVVMPLVGWATFHPSRARAVKRAERQDELIEHVVEIRQYHPEIVKVGRLDRHPFFIIPHICVLGYSLCVFSGATLTSNVAALGAQTRYTMATCFLVGSLLVLAGLTLGGKVGKWRIPPANVHDHATAAVLGDDITLPYRISMAGMGAMSVSSTIYCLTSFQSTTGSLGGWLTGGLSLACLICIAVFQSSITVFTRWDTTLISEAQARIDAGGGDDAVD